MTIMKKNLQKTKQQLVEEIEGLQHQNTILKRKISHWASEQSSNARIAEAYQTAIEDQTEMIAQYLPNGIITFINRAYCKYLQRSREELVGTCLYQLITPANYQQVRENISSLNIHNPMVISELKVINPAGEERWYQWVNRAIFDQHDKIVEIQGVGRDITNLKNIENALKRKDTVLEAQNKILEKKNIALHEILEQIEIEKKQIKDDVVHNVETLLLPLLRKIQAQCSSVNPKYFNLLEQNLFKLVSSFSRKISQAKIRLTPREIEICNLIRNGFSNKEIAEFLHISFYTVEVHRTHIRKKFKLNRKKINLPSFLNSID